MRKAAQRVLILLVLATGLATLSSCDSGGDMADTPRYEPLEPSKLFADGTSARQPPDGTVSRDDWVDDPGYHTGIASGAFVQYAPVPVDMAVLQRGMERYNIYCAPCHGYDGEGEGIIVERGYTPPPSLHDDRLLHVQDGYLFNVITRGFGRMPPYAAQVHTQDRWAIIAYVRALQLSQNIRVDDLNAEQRQAVADSSGSHAGMKGDHPDE